MCQCRHFDVVDCVKPAEKSFASFLDLRNVALGEQLDLGVDSRVTLLDARLHFRNLKLKF